MEHEPEVAEEDVLEIVVAEATLEEDVKDEVVLRQLLLMALIGMMYLAHSQEHQSSNAIHLMP